MRDVATQLLVDQDLVADPVTIDLPKLLVRRQMNQAGNILLSALEPFTDEEFFAGAANGISPAWTVGHLACVMDLFTHWIEPRELAIPAWMHSIFNSTDIEKPAKSKADSVDPKALPKADVVRLFRATQIEALKLLDQFDSRLWESRTSPTTPETLPTYGSIWQALGVHTFWHLGELCGCISRFHGTHSLNTVAHYFYYRPSGVMSGIFPTSPERT
jgi:hypothetical protein